MSALSSTLATPLPTRPVSPQLLDPRLITSPKQIAAQISLLTQKEQDLTLTLNSLISDRTHLDGALTHLRELGSQVQQLALEVDGGGIGKGVFGGNRNDIYEYEELEEGDVRGEGLVERVRRVWETSERVGGKVRRLDEEVGRVREATDIVTEVLELKVGDMTINRR
jgi:hypothetical protein